MEWNTERGLEGFGGTRLTHLPGLDGLRGLAVAAVLLFHGQFGWASGGYLGVSLFFTLSGFLITSVLLAESRPEGQLLTHFWARRFRRLLPAAWLTVAVVLLTGRFWMDAASIGELRGDGMAALLNVANWRFLFASQSYGELFGAPSPLLHFWSLAVEEQIYLIFPVVLIGLSRLLRQRLNALCWVLAAGAVTSWVAPIVLGFSDDRIYYGTDTRAGELLAGATLAAVLAHSDLRRSLVRHLVPRTVAVTAGTVALVVTLLSWVALDQNSSFLYSGGLAMISIASVGLIVAAVLPAGPVAALVGISPLRHLGRISYGVYLFHWPIFVALRQFHPSAPNLVIFAVGTSLSIALAQASYTWLEMPIRERNALAVPRPFGQLRPLQLSVAMIPVLLFSAFTVPGRTPEAASLDFASASNALERINDRGQVDAVPFGGPTPTDVGTGSPGGPDDGDPDGTTTTAPVPPPPVPRVGFFGDSVAVTVANLLATTTDGPPIDVAGAGAEQRCGVALRGAYYLEDFPEEFKSTCRWDESWPALLDTNGISVAVVNSSLFELLPRLLPGENKTVNLLDQRHYDYVKAEFLRATDALASGGALVLWLNVPELGDSTGGGITASLDSARKPELVARLNTLIAEVVAERPKTARLIDVHEFMGSHRNDTAMRPDGLHYNWKIDPVGNPASAFLKEEINSEFAERWDGLFR